MTLRHIIVLRHAHAEPAASGQDDANRVLTSVGRAEADAAGAWLAAHGAAPARVLCSPAVRTRETCDPAAGALGQPDVRIDERIYEATPGTLIRILDENADAESILLVGHNPGLECLVALLTEGTSDGGRGMPPGSIAWMTLDTDAVLEPGAGTLRHFWSP